MYSFAVFLFVDCVTQESHNVGHIEELRRSAASQVAAANRRDKYMQCGGPNGLTGRLTQGASGTPSIAGNA